MYRGIIENGVIKCPTGKIMPNKPVAEPCSSLLTDNERTVIFPGLANPPPIP